MDFIEWLIASAIVGVLIVVGYAIYDDVTSEKLTLKKAEWSCSLSETETHTRPQIVGKITVMIPYTVDVCQVYKRIK